MANEEHLRILKQGVEGWNQWRREQSKTTPDLNGADLSGASLSGANLSGARLKKADLSEADLGWSDLSQANLSRANLNRVELTGANLNKANLNKTSLQYAILGWTLLVGVDLSNVKGLDTIEHIAPSPIGIDTIYLSQGKIPESFLRGAGVPDSFITYMHSLTSDAIQYYSCFISHSSKNDAFVRRLYSDLQTAGVRCWVASEDLKWGAEIRDGIDQAIRLHDKLLLVLSEDSVASNWVQSEVEAAFEEERLRKQSQQKRLTVLFPIRIDEAVMDTGQAWAKEIRRTRNIGDFTQWKQHDHYQQAFGRLLHDLKEEE